VKLVKKAKVGRNDPCHAAAEEVQILHGKEEFTTETPTHKEFFWLRYFGLFDWKY
jgi:hypothetical protein